jgi:hypothetical protein
MRRAELQAEVARMAGRSEVWWRSAVEEVRGQATSVAVEAMETVQEGEEIVEMGGSTCRSKTARSSSRTAETL